MLTFSFSQLLVLCCLYMMASPLPETAAQAQAQQVPLKKNGNPFTDEFKTLAEENLRRWNVPGVAVGVVDGGDVWGEGFGIATFPSTPVTAETLFHGASTTKAFTVALIALLMKSGEFPELEKGWKTPVSEVLREDFVLEDPYRTEHATLEDLLSLRTGMPRHDISYGGTDEKGKTRGLRDLVRGLRGLELAGGFRERWIYCNMMYATASYAVETLTGKWMGDVLREKIWEPLGMESTYFSATDARAGPNHFAQGYVYHNDKFQEVPDQKFEVVSGAGAIISNVLDYTKWLKALLTHTGPLSKEDITDLLKPRSFPPHFYDPNPFTGTHTYALGWFAGIYHGYEYYEHSGGMEAFGAEVIFFPKLNYGVVAFGNTGMTSNAVELALRWKLIDDKLKIPAEKRFDWNKGNYDRVQAVRTAFSNRIKTTYPDIPSPPLPLSLPLEKYTGTYTHPSYHNLTLELCPPTYSPLVAQNLCCKRDNATWKIKLDFTHVSGEFFLVDFEPLHAPSVVAPLFAPVEFRIDVKGTVERVGVGFEGELGREGLIWFVRVEGEGEKNV